MCGIAGIAAFGNAPPSSIDDVRRMCGTIVHRGPDEGGSEVVNRVAMGMQRLAIIDLSGGSQPMTSRDGALSIVFNGEIYNFRELRSELARVGYAFSTNSDTEVLLYAYAHYGDDFVQHLNGMFAFSLHDRRQNRLLIARDHLGIKPLFYSIQPDCLVWGSEIKAILASRRVDRKLDLDALAEFFAWEYVPADRTLFTSIRKLEPGCLLSVDLASGELAARQYWDVPVGQEEHGLSTDTWMERLESCIHDAVQRQLISDVPLGAFLSGGVDSSLIVAEMGDAKTFSIGFRDPSYNELAYSSEVARHLGVDHTTEIIEPEVAGLFEHLMHFMDDPIGDFSIFPTYLVSRLARKDVTVALAGDGGDELFGGYETYLASGVASRYDRVPRLVRSLFVEALLDRVRPRKEKKGLINKAKRFVEGAREPAALGHARWRIFLGDALRAEFFAPGAAAAMREDPGRHISSLYARARDADPLNQSLYVDTRSYLVDNCLVKSDRMSMAVSLEARVPLIDKDLVDLAFRVPGDQKVVNGETKAILKRIAAKKLPKHCVYRPKEGFSIPIKHWLGTQFKPLLDAATDPRKIRADGIFSESCVQRLKAEHLAGRANHSHILWSLIVFDNWKRKWLEGETA